MREVKSKSYKILIPVLVFILSVCITLVVWDIVRRSIVSQERIQFINQAKQITSLVEQRINLYANVVYGAKGLFAASHSVENNEWKAYVQQLQIPVNYPGISSMVYIERVSSSSASTFPYTIRPYAPKDDYYPFTYIATSTNSSTSTQSAYGYDASSDPVRLEAMTEAVNKNAPAASGIVPTVVDHLPSFGVYEPVYRNEGVTTTSKQRWNALIGFIYVPFRVNTLFQDLSSSPLFNKSLKVTIYDASTVSGSTADNFVYDSQDQATKTLDNSTHELYYISHLNIDGRTWTLLFRPLPGYSLDSSESSLPTTILILGNILSLLLAILLYLYVASREKELIMQAEAEWTKELDETKRYLESILNSIGEGVVATDREGLIMLVNPSFERLLGLSFKNIQGKKFTDIVPMMDGENSIVEEKNRLINRSMLENSTITSDISTETYFKRHDGTLFPVAVTVSPISIGDDLIGAVEVFRDITRESEIDKAKSEFVSLASHQLRTPLTSIKWNTELLADKLIHASASQKNHLQELSNATIRMTDIIDSFLNVSRIELGTIKIDPQKLSLEERVDSILSEFAASANEKGIHLVREITYAGEIYQDKIIITNVLQNLLSNAIKYTPSEGTVTLIIEEDQYNARNVLIKVTDTGYGIPASQHTKIFSKMFRADNAKQKVPDGNGLGLYIVRAMLTLVQGSISFKSVENKGTTFCVTLPKKYHG